MQKRFLKDKLIIVGFGNAAKDTYKIIENKQDIIIYDSKKGAGSFFKDFLKSHNSNKIVYIAVPVSLHFEFAKSSLEEGKNVIIEKTATTSVESWNKLINLAKKMNLEIVENDKIYDSKLHNFLKNFELENGKPIYSYLPYLRKSNRPILEVYSKEKTLDSSFEIGFYPLSLSQILHGNPNNFMSSSLMMAGVDSLSSYVLEYDNSISVVSTSRSLFGNLKDTSIHYKDCLLNLELTNDDYPGCIIKIIKDGKNIKKIDMTNSESRFNLLDSINNIIRAINTKNKKEIETRNNFTKKRIEIISSIYKIKGNNEI